MSHAAQVKRPFVLPINLDHLMFPSYSLYLPDTELWLCCPLTSKPPPAYTPILQSLSQISHP